MYTVRVTTQHEKITLSRYQIWCAQNINPYGAGWWMLFNGPHQTSETFYFDNEDDAVLFKLTFAEYLVDG